MHSDENMLEGEIQEEKIEPLLKRINIDRELKEQIKNKLIKTGMYFHIFARVKSCSSLCQKLRTKEQEYKEKNKKLQDLIGIRVVLYYVDDIPICQKIIESLFEVSKKDCAIDKPKIDEFKPKKLNLICRIPDSGDDDYIERIPEELWDNYLIDKTFEVQIRTIFSEGWHEVEHDVRYKHLTEWNVPDYYDFNRQLNGINATLEVCDNTIISILESLAYQCYKDNKIKEMFRYKLRIHMQKEELKSELSELLGEDNGLLKKFYRLERGELLQILADSTFANIPVTLENVIYICNALQIHNESITRMMPNLIEKCVKQYLETN